MRVRINAVSSTPTRLRDDAACTNVQSRLRNFLYCRMLNFTMIISDLIGYFCKEKNGCSNQELNLKYDIPNVA